MENKGTIEDKHDEEPSLLENDGEDSYRLSTISVLELEKRLLENSPNHLLVYFLTFAAFEFILLYLLQRYFYLFKQNLIREKDPTVYPNTDFEICKYMFFRVLAVIPILTNKQKGITHFKNVFNEFKMNRSFLNFAIFDVLIYFCIFSLVQNHMIASVILIIKSKEVFEVVKKYLRGFYLRDGEIVLLGSAICFLICVYILSSYAYYLSLLWIVGGAFMFYFNEEVICHNIDVRELEVIKQFSKMTIFFLILAKCLLEYSEWTFAFHWLDILVGVVVALSDYFRFYVVKRIQRLKKDNTARTYHPTMIIFTAGMAFVLDIVLWNEFLGWAEFIGCAALIAGFVYFEQNAFMRIVRNRPDTSNTTEDLVFH